MLKALIRFLFGLRKRKEVYYRFYDGTRLRNFDDQEKEGQDNQQFAPRVYRKAG